MRTSVTLDPDVERLIRDFMKENQISFKEALNRAVRNGLLHGKSRQAGQFVQKSMRMGGSRNFRWDKALSIAEAIEDEEIRRRLFA